MSRVVKGCQRVVKVMGELDSQSPLTAAPLGTYLVSSYHRYLGTDRVISLVKRSGI